MKNYEIRLASGSTLEIDLESMFLTYEMVEQIIKENAPEYTTQEWALFEKDSNNEWYEKFDSTEDE